MELRNKLHKDRWEDVKVGKKEIRSKQVIINISPQLLSAEDVSGAEEGDTGESQVLVQHEHTYWD